jgi:hypothetical protein
LDQQNASSWVNFRSAATGYDTWLRDGLSFRLKERQAYSDYFENSPPDWKFYQRVGIPAKFHMECEFFDIEKFLAGQATSIPRAVIAPTCYERDPSKAHAVMLWGDSHVEQLSDGLRNNLPADWQVLQVASSGCLPTANAPAPSTVDHCLQSNWFAQKTIAATHPDVVIVAQNLDHSLEGFRAIAARLRSLGVPKVIFTGPDPHWTADLPRLMMTNFWLTAPRRTWQGINMTVVAHNAALQAGFQNIDGAVYVNLTDFFCNKDGCLTYLGEDRLTGITSYDYGHLMPAASNYLARELLVKTVLGKAAP